MHDKFYSLTEKLKSADADEVANRPFAASHSRAAKPPRWRAKVALGQDKQYYIILNG